MKKSIKRNYIFELIIFIFVIILSIIIRKTPHLTITFNLTFFTILAVIIYLTNGFPRNKNYLNKISTRYIIIALLTYVIFVYLLALFTGFLKTVYKNDIISIIKNIIPIIILVLSKEIIRYIICKTSNHKKIIIIITILYISIDIIMKNYQYSFKNIYHIFTFVFLVCLPIISKQSLCTYMTTKIGIKQSIIYNLAFELSIYIFPIYPDLGNYLNSVIGLIFPYLVYIQLSKLIKYNKNKPLILKKRYYTIIFIPVIIFTLIIIILISGIFSHKMIAIGSDSMNPIYYKGDAIIYKKINLDKIKENDILVYNYNGNIITHRVKEIIIKGNNLYFKTKGDNNDNIDQILIESKDVYGIVKYIVKYVGYPTIWLQELF